MRPANPPYYYFDSKLKRASNTLALLGMWLEDEAPGKDEAFAEALGR